ncbi:hypothetical protein QQP08_005277 [Theobroma cacao]|nr:hypothetical protein QQP08_005276 [Theobroma cacao]WRX12790.1 hypothetical protein QQP08_005277 [Theobroma cacao]
MRVGKMRELLSCNSNLSSIVIIV